MTWTFDSVEQERAHAVMSEYMWLWTYLYRHEQDKAPSYDRLCGLWDRYRKDRPHVKDWREVE